MKDVVIFDVDGTLADTRKGIIKALNHTLREEGLKEIKSENENFFIGPPIKRAFMEQLHFEEDYADSLTKKYRKIYVSHYIEDSFLYDGTIKVLQILKEQGYIIGIATMKTKPQLDKLLNIFSLEQYFDIIMTASEHIEYTKADMLEIVRKRLDTKSRKMYMVGDTNGDRRAAMVNNFRFIAADYGYGNIKEMEGYHISKIEDVISLIMEDNSE